MMNINTEDLKKVVDPLLSQYFWWFVLTAVVFYFKDFMENTVSGISLYFSNDYKIDDIILLGGGTRKARIESQSITKTVLYFFDTNSRLVIHNKDFNGLLCEKVLAKPDENE